MPSPNDNKDAVGSAPESSPVVKQLVDQVAQLTGQLAKAQSGLADNAAILGDSDIQKLLKLKSDGNSFEIAVPESEIDPLADLLRSDEDEVSTKPDAFDDFTPRQVVEHIGKHLSGIVEAAVTEKLKPLQEQVQQSETQRQSDLTATHNANLQLDIEALSAKRSDLKDYHEDMIKLSQNPLTVEQYYNLAKISKIGLPEDAPETERPFNVLESTRPRVGSSSTEVRRGRVGMASMLKEVLDKKFQ